MSNNIHVLSWKTRDLSIYSIWAKLVYPTETLRSPLLPTKLFVIAANCASEILRDFNNFASTLASANKLALAKPKATIMPNNIFLNTPNSFLKKNIKPNSPDNITTKAKKQEAKSNKE